MAAFVVGLLLLAIARAGPLRAETNTYRDSFDDLQCSWTLDPEGTTATYRQRRHGQAHSGSAAEQFVFLARQADDEVLLWHDLPVSLRFNELTASLWVRSNRAGMRLGLEIRFPGHTDPRNGGPLRGLVLGDAYTAAGEWQRLTCQTTDNAVQDLVHRLRQLFQAQPGTRPVDARELYVERVVLRLELQPGNTEISLDDLEFGPIVPPPEPKPDGLALRREPLPPQARAVIGDDQVLVDGRPTILLFTPYQGEEVDALGTLGFNVAWIEHYDDTTLLRALDAAGMGAMANPLPRPIPLEEAVQQDLGLVSFAQETSPILFWNMGTRLSPSSLRTQAVLMDKVRAADARFARPILVDVMGDERAFHRHADMIGSSRHCLHTSTTPLDYLEFLRRKRRLALPDRPVFTLLQTEPADANLVSRTEGQSLPIVEPEQIWMQGYAALAAGYKGIGFWKRTSLTAPIPGNDERRLAISLFNSHVRLLEPWLASSKFMQMVPANLEQTAPPENGGRGPFGRLQRLVPGVRTQAAPASSRPSELQVAIFSCDYGLLLLPVWYEDGAQFQPGPMSTSHLSFVVSIGRENAQAWEVTTTGIVPLPSGGKRPAGGMPITLNDFDQFSAVILTHGDAAVRELEHRVLLLRERCARDWIDLASAKITRVTEVHEKLSSVAPGIPHGDFILSQARRLVEMAERDFQQGDFDGARRNSRKAMQLTRSVQRRHWENAVTDRLTSGVSSPHTICFQTLPDHWAMISAIGRRPEGSTNLLKSGEFEDPSTFFGHGWKHLQGRDPRVRPRGELFGAGAAQGSYCLRLLAEPVDRSQPPDEVSEPPEVVISPPIPVYTGQIVHISGKIQIPQRLTGHPDGLVLYENIKGTVGALRFREPTPKGDWQTFQLIREVHSSRDLIITIELRGLGDARIDDLKVVAIDPE